MEGPEWYAPVHGIMHSRTGAEETAFSGGLGEGGHRQGFQRLWAPPGDGDFLQIPGLVILETDDEWTAVVRNLARA